MVDSIFEYIEQTEKAAVLFLYRSQSVPACLKSYADSPLVKTVRLDEITADIMQVIRVPQLRIFINGSEDSVYVGDEILNFRLEKM